MERITLPSQKDTPRKPPVTPFSKNSIRLLEASQGIEDVADHLGHKHIQNTRIYAQITTSLRQAVFAKLERHPKIVRVA